MAAQSRTRPESGTRQTGIYVYGILPEDVELQPDVRGVGDPPSEVRLVRQGDLAALVSDVDVSKPLGRPDDLIAHEDLLDSIAADVPVLPMRFGAVVSSEDAVAHELLEAHQEEFASALEQLEDRAEYVVRGRYVEHAIMQEILSENSQAARLRGEIKDANPDATREARIHLGEIISAAIAEKREHDTRALGDALAGDTVASVTRPATHELDSVHVAFLVGSDAAGDVEQAVEKLAADWEGRVELRLLGPMAAYDFVATTAPEV